MSAAVLPPIPTTGLTEADAGALAIRVREQMVNALREISVHVAAPKSLSPTPQPTTESKSDFPPLASSAAAVASPDFPTPPQSQLYEPEIVPAVDARAGEPQIPVIPSSDSIAASVSSIISGGEKQPSENGTETSTEEDDGMVLVGRPT